MTTPYNPRTPINELHDMIDKHVPQAEARLQIHYDKAAEEFRISPDAIHSFRQYRKLPKLRK